MVIDALHGEHGGAIRLEFLEGLERVTYRGTHIVLVLRLEQEWTLGPARGTTSLGMSVIWQCDGLEARKIS